MEQADDPIEIEVGSSRPAEDATVPPPDTTGGSQMSRASLIATALAMLVGGVLIGRSTAPDPITGAEATESSAAPVDDGPRLVAVPPVDTVPPVDLLRPTTTAARDGVVVTTRQLEIDERVLGTELRLVGLGDGELYDLDLTTGTVTVTAHSELTARSGIGQEERQLFAGEDWVLVSNSWQSGFVVYRGDGQPTERRGRHTLVHVPGTARFWAQDGERVVEIDLDGTPTGAELEVDVDRLVPDPIGGVMVERAGRWYSLVDDSVVPLPEGVPRSVSPEFVVMSSCDERLVCALELFDRATEISREVSVDATVDPAEPETYRYRAGSDRPSIAPGGDHAVVIQTRPGWSSLELIDLATGERRRLPSSDAWSTSLVWSPDGRLLFVTSGGQVNVFDTETGASFPLLGDAAGRWYRLTARPAATPRS